MFNLDEIMQERLVLLERGVPLEQVLAGLPAEAAELTPLLTLAAAAHSTKHPALPPQVVLAQHARVEATHKKVINASRTANRLTGWARSRSPQMLAGGLALVLVVVFATIGVSLALTHPAAAQASLADMNGMVEMAAADGSSDWHFVAAGETIRQGQRIHTYADSGVTLVFQDGSRTRVGADADLTLTTLNTAGAGVLQARISQDAGEMAYTIVPLHSSGYFEVSTPAGMVKVHGTDFNVAVNPGGEVLFAVTSGKVQVSQADRDLFLLSGQAAAILPGQGLTEPGYQFNLLGSLTRIQGDQWVVNGVTFTVTPQTDILGTYQPGDWLSVRGRVLAGGQWAADRIEPARKEDSKLRFTGVIEKMGGVPGTWQVSGKMVQVNAETELSKNLKLGAAVEVVFVRLPDGSWLAKEIDSLEEDWGKLTATPQTRTPSTPVTASATPTMTITVTPTVTGTQISPTPTVTGTLATPTVTFTPTATVIPKNDSARCDNRDQQQPEALRLAQRYQVTYAEIMDWFCKGFGFGEIDLAYGLALDTGKPVSAIFAMRSSGLGWGQIKQNLSRQITPNATARGNGNGKPPAKTPGPKNK